jgi:LytS/YehU family sensor histidine kinase
MTNKTYWLAQILGWGLAYLLLVLTIINRSAYLPAEFFYAAVLVCTTAVGSHILRHLYKRSANRITIKTQVLTLLLGSVVFGAISSLVLICTVFISAQTDITFPIPESQRWFVTKTVFISNFPNMVALLFLWSATYFATIKVRQLRQANLLLQSTKLEALINQLNPHFLFNAINNIRALILEDPARARDKLTALSDMLRYTLNKDNKVKVKFIEELQVVEDYIALCAIQFEERLVYKSTIAPNCKEAFVPRMLLQLCVENAVKHGISHLKDGGKIELVIAHDDDRVSIRITNDGKMIEEKSHSGIGLENIKQRLSIMYGTNATVSLQQHDSKVTTNITIPLEYQLENSHY